MVIGRQEHVVVLGAGISGVGTALSLARRGIAVTLIDQDERVCNRASLRNEGKIHLGFIYANDPTFATAAMQLTGALRFRAILESWIGPDANALAQSTPFVYLIANDSLLSVAALERHYEEVAAEFRAQCAENADLDYLGARHDQLYERLLPSELRKHFDEKRIVAAYRTAERALDTEEMAIALRQAVDRSPLITFLPRHRVRELHRRADGLRIQGSHPEGRWTIDADHVVNALWENRIVFDQMVGATVVQGWVHRLKYRVIARVPPHLRDAPSATMVLGPYGDVVIRPNGTSYLSWYPKGLRGWSKDIAPPESWNAACRGELTPEVAAEVSSDILTGIDAWYPGIAQSQPLLIDAGAIVAYGHSDIDDAKSALHLRSQIGVMSAGAYHSIEPGKLTTAPLYAEEAAQRVYDALATHERGRRIA